MATIRLINNSQYVSIFGGNTEINTAKLTEGVNVYTPLKIADGYRTVPLTYIVTDVNGNETKINHSVTLTYSSPYYTKQNDNFRFQNTTFTDDIVSIEITDNENQTPTQITTEELAYTNNLENIDFLTYNDVVYRNKLYVNVATYFYCVAKGEIIETPKIVINGTATNATETKIFYENKIVTSYLFQLSSANAKSENSITLEGKAEGLLTSLITLGNSGIEFTANSDTEIDNQKTTYYIEIKAKSGYVIEGTPKVKATYRGYSGNTTTLDYPMIAKQGESETYYINLSISTAGSNTPKQFYLDNSSANLPRVLAETISDSPLISDYGVIRVYKIDKAIADSLMRKRFYNPETNTYEDLGAYILKYVRYPFDVDIQDSETVKYGWFDTKITADLVQNQIFTLSLGKHLISGLYNDSSDIGQCQIVCVLPYYGLYELDNKYINTEIKIVYQIDILSNSTTIEIYSDDVLVDMIATSIGYDIPYILLTDRVNPNVNLQSNVLKKYEPKIIVRQKPKVNGFYYETAKTVATLENISGYIKATDYNISGDISDIEKQMIVNLMNNGIII